VGKLIDYKLILNNPEKRKKLKHLYWLVFWWEEEKRKRGF
jgi:hypothetical protein